MYHKFHDSYVFMEKIKIKERQGKEEKKI